MCRHEGTFVIIGLHWLYLLVCARIRAAQLFFLPPNANLLCLSICCSTPLIIPHFTPFSSLSLFPSFLPALSSSLLFPLQVCDAKPILRKTLLDRGDAIPYFEPESLVISRTGDEVCPILYRSSISLSLPLCLPTSLSFPLFSFFLIY